MNIKNVKSVFKKEIQSYLNTPSSYIVAIVFLLLWEFMFFRSVFLIGEASVRGLFNILPWLMLILVPAITMGTLAKEKDDGTLELILTHPINELEFVIGKFLGALAFVSITLLFAIPIALSISKFGHFDWGVFAGQFIGGILYAAAFISLGVFVSSLVSSQIAALLVSVGAGFLLVIAGTEFFTISLPLSIAAITERLSLVTHLDSVSRGVLDLRDIWYFLSFIGIFLSLAYLQVLKDRFGNRKSMYRSFQIGITLFIGIAILTNVIGNRIPGRLDLTQGRVYTLAGSTKKVLNNLDDLVTINLYVSEKLPAQYSPLVRDTKDLLRDYKNNSNNNVIVNIKDPSEDEDAEREALSSGVREIQFNVIGQEEFQVKTGYFGLVVSYAGQFESIPFIQTTGDLEYQLTSFIRKLTVKDKKKVGFLSGHGEKDLSLEYTFLNNELLRQFEVTTLPLVSSEENEVPLAIDPSLDVVVIAGPNLVMDGVAVAALDSYISQGGSVMFLLDTYSVNMEVQNISPNANSLASFVSKYGVTVNEDVMYDLRFNDTVRFSDGLIAYFLPYPFWSRVAPVDPTLPITFKIDNMLMPWASTMFVDEDIASSTGYTITQLIHSSPFAGVLSGAISMDPNQTFPQENLLQRLLAVSLTPEDTKGKMIVVSDSEFLTDQYVQSGPQNLIFGVNAISWLAEEESFGDIRIKERVFGEIQFENKNQSTTTRAINMALAGIIPAFFGFVYLARRRKLSSKTYKKR